MPQVPKSKPQLKESRIIELIDANGIDREKYPVVIVGIRGYYLDSMGAPGKNDRGIWDDLLSVHTPSAFATFNANTDPSRYRNGKGTGSSKGMATLHPGAWLYKIGPHKGKSPAMRQAADVTVVRDGTPDYLDTGDFAINHHSGSALTTSSAGCQTLPPSQWHSYINLIVGEFKRYNVKVAPYLLFDEETLRKGELYLPYRAEGLETKKVRAA